MIRSYLTLTAALALTGCFILPSAQAPKTGAVATGEPLNVVDDVRVWTTTHKEKVGETVYKDDRGQTIATADTYQQKTQVHTKQVWFPVQGAQQVPDEDFFRIAGDQQALAETEKMRDSGQSWNTRGKVTMGVGVLGVIAGYFVTNTLGRSLLITGGGLAISGGWYMAYYGAQHMNPDHHAVDRSVAERAAREYNSKLSGVTVGKTF